MDYLHLGQCKARYEYFQQVIYLFSKFGAFPAKTKSGRAAADSLFNEYNLGFSFPRPMLHDHYKDFDSKLFQSLPKLTGIRPSLFTL